MASLDRHGTAPLHLVLWLLLPAFALAATIPQLPALRDALHLMSRADARDLPSLLLLEAVFFANLGLLYYTSFRASGLDAQPLRFTLLAAAGNLVNLVSKSSGFGALALFLAEGKRRSTSNRDTVLAYGAAYALGELAFLVILCLAAGGLYFSGSLTAAEGAAIAAVVALMAVIGLTLAAALRSEDSLQRLFRLARLPMSVWARLRRRPAPAVDDGLRASASETLTAVRFIWSRRSRFGLPLASALGVELMSALFLLFSADLLGIHMSFLTALAGYAITLVFTILSFTPGGLGFAEGSLAVFLASTGMARSDAIAVTLTYRLFTYWLPILIGLASFIALKWRDGSGVQVDVPAST